MHTSQHTDPQTSTDAEQTRHQYLKMLGVDSWLARTALPGAAPSEDWVKKFIYDDVLSEQERASNNIQGLVSQQPQSSAQQTGHEYRAGSDKGGQKNSQTTSAHSYNAKQARALAASFETPEKPAISTESSQDKNQDSSLDNTGQSVVSDENNQLVNQSSTVEENNTNASTNALTNTTTNTFSNTFTNTIVPVYTPSASQSSRPAPVMRLMFWLYEDVLVVDSLPTHSRGTLSSVKYEQLLTNLIKAMGCDAQRIMVSNTGEKSLANGHQPYTLNWPTLAGLSIDQGWNQAVSAVQHKLAKTLQYYSPKTVLMLGESAGQMLMNLDDDFDALRGVTFAIRKEITAMTTFSLTQMLNVPGCKRDVWFDLQKVIKAD